MNALSLSPHRFGSLQLFRGQPNAQGQRTYTMVISHTPQGCEDRVYMNGLLVGKSPTVRQLTQRFDQHENDQEVTHQTIAYLQNPHDLNTQCGETRPYPFLKGLNAVDYFREHHAWLAQQLRDAKHTFVITENAIRGLSATGLGFRVTEP